MQLEFEDTKIIRDFEGHSLTTYLCPAGVPTISWGITGPNIKMGMTITEEESKAMFMHKIQEFAHRLDACVCVTLNKNQYIALLSLIWNIGPTNFMKSSVLKFVNEKKMEEAAQAFSKHCKAKGKVLKGLVRRREREAELFRTLPN